VKKTCWDYHIKEDMKSLGLSREDDDDKCQRGLRIKGATV